MSKWQTITEPRKQQLDATAQRRHRVQAAIRDYLDRTGMSRTDFARRIGYGTATLTMFLNDRYHHVGGDDSRISKAAIEFMTRYPVQAPSTFAGTMYEIGNVRVMRSIITRSLERAQIWMAYAPPGSGKTDVVRFLIAEHNKVHGLDSKRQIFHIYCRQGIRPRDLLRRVAYACGTSGAGEIDRLIANLQWEFKDKRVLLVFDEAQHLSIDCFETLRELFDQEPHFSLMFTGSHELDRIFTAFSGTLEQLERRVTDKVTLPPVTREEAAGIVRSELAGLVDDIDDSLVHEQIEKATVQVRVRRETQRYISIGRLMAALREIREGLAQAEVEDKEEVVA
jgi:DNA transposition AAA+ family ATPase